MNHYSIFERGMHWLLLIFVFLKGVIFYIVIIRRLSIVNSLIEPYQIILESIKSDFIYIILAFAYLLIFFMKRKVKKNVSIIITLLLILNLIFDFIGNVDSVLELRVLIYLTMIILFLVSFNTTEKIALVKEKDDFILDDLD